MRIKVLTIIAVTFFLLSSCTKEGDPVLEIYVTTLESEKWEEADVHISNVKFAIENEEGTIGSSSLQQYFGVRYDVGLDEEQSTLIFNDRHFDISKLVGLRLNNLDILLSNSDSGISNVISPYIDYIPLSESISLENDRRYKVEFILDLDELVYEENGQLYLDPSYVIEVTEF